MLDCTYCVQIPHHAGQLARVAGAIAQGDGLIGDVVTISRGREHSVREITVEVRDGPPREPHRRPVPAGDAHDVDGTAVVTLAATIVACRHGGVDPRTATVGQLGLGAAGLGIALLMIDSGVRRVIAFDPSPALHLAPSRTESTSDRWRR